MAETLHTCPDCRQDGFTQKGLKAHQGGKTCKTRAAQMALAVQADTPQPLTAAQTAQIQLQMQQGANRYKVLHEATGITVVQLKLFKFLCGLEANLLADLHRELYGETRGGGVAKDAPLLGPWVEEHIGITERAWRKKRAFFQLIVTAHPELAKKLIACWETWKSGKLKVPAKTKPKALKPGAKARPAKAALTTTPGMAIMDLAKLTAEDAKELLLTADEWGLHELFETPLKDVTPTTDEPDPPQTLDGLLKFWQGSFGKRAMNGEFLKLPKEEREALLTTVNEMRDKLADSLKKPTSKAA